MIGKNLMVSWSPEELERVVAEHGDPDWIRHYYFRPHPVVLIESAVFLASLVALIYAS